MTQNVTKESINDVDMHIKIFLQCFHRFDITMQQKDVKTKPKWLTSYNFISLTNIPNILEQFGPVRNLWEGGGLGGKKNTTYETNLVWVPRKLASKHDG